MPFTFKLSKRLALMKASLASTRLTLPSSSVVQVVLSPKTFTFQIDDVAQPTAVGLTATSDTVLSKSSISGELTE